MSHYHHLTILEREKLAIYHAQGLSITKIAAQLKRNKSTISRELTRNASKADYLPCRAQMKYTNRRQACRPHRKLDSKELAQFVESKFLDHQWSPEQISMRLAMERGMPIISTATIYRAIYAGLFDAEAKRRYAGVNKAKRKLRHRGKTRRNKRIEERRGKIVISNNLTDRPVIANDRGRIGDWEGDTVAGKTGGACLLTNADRKSRFLVGRKLPKKTSEAVRDATIDSLKGYPVHTITPDRGKEFAKHRQVTEVLHAPYYFPPPHQPWQRGTNENTNGLLREYFPKGRSLDDVSEEEIQRVVYELNTRPRKCLAWRTPYEVFFNKVLHLT